MYSTEIRDTWTRDGSAAGSLPYGFFIKWMYGSLVFCYRSQKQDGQKIIVNTDLVVYFARKKKFLQKLENEIEERLKCYYSNLAASKDFVTVRNGANYCGKKQLRNLDSIFTDNDIHKELYDDICKFIANKDIYKSLNYPYKYSALLYGQPGTGKTSTILAIASELKRDICYINLSKTSVSDAIDMINSSTNERIYVFEDIDALATGISSTREASAASADEPTSDNIASSLVSKLSLSLSDLLNITDGLLSSDGAICLFTTNHPEKLDPALLRAGRMNKLVEFKYLSADTARKMVKTYLATDCQDFADGIKPAELQEDILSILLSKKDMHVLDKYKR